MMLVFYFGMGASALLAGLTQSTWQLAAALTLLGLFSAIYHPVGIPMLVQRSTRPGLTIGINGLSGNLGVALSAVATGALVKYAGWRMAFVVPAMVAFACGIAFARLAPHELVAPARRRPTRAMEGKRTLAHVFAVVRGSSSTTHSVTMAIAAIRRSNASNPAVLTNGPSSQTASELTPNATARRIPETRERIRSST